MYNKASLIFKNNDLQPSQMIRLYEVWLLITRLFLKKGFIKKITLQPNAPL